MKKALIVGFLTFINFIFTIQTVWAGCSGSSPMWASTPDSTSLTSCISAASAGDTIIVSAGNAIWGAGAISIPKNKPLKIIGSGATNTIITLSGNYVLTIGEYIGKEYPGGGEYSATRISGIKFYSSTQNAKYAAISVKGQGWRIDHCTYESVESSDQSTGGFFISATGLNTSIQPYGLVDNNTIINGKVDISGPSSSADQSAAWADSIDLGGQSAVYVEDNNFSSTVNYKVLVMDSGYAAKHVFRYNTVTNGDVQNHALQSAGDRGTRKLEVYGNEFIVTHDAVSIFIEFLSGTGVAFYNKFSGVSTNYSGHFAFGFEFKRHNVSVGWLGVCDGTHAWDKNELGQSGSLCRDQPGAGMDGGWTGYTASSQGTPTDQIRTPIYVWSMFGTKNIMYNYSTSHVKADRDYFYTAASFDGSSGVGCGTLANRPASASKIGVAYWATNQSCSVIDDYVGVDPTLPISGTLYVWNGSGWEKHFTPYTYPHPRRKPEKPTNVELQ
jgi:hypothetical protein